MVTSVTPTNQIAGHDTMASVTSHDSRALRQDSECVSTRRITSLIPDKLKLWTRLVVSLLPRSVSPCLTQPWKVNSRLNPSGRLHSCHLPRPPSSSLLLRAGSIKPCLGTVHLLPVHHGMKWHKSLQSARSHSPLETKRPSPGALGWKGQTWTESVAAAASALPRPLAKWPRPHFTPD